MPKFLSRGRACDGCLRAIIGRPRHGFCDACWRAVIELPAVPARGVCRLYEYGPPLDAALARLKYHRGFHTARTLAGLIAARWSELPLTDAVQLVPVPSNPGRVLARGSHHTLLLAQWLVAALPSHQLSIRRALRRTGGPSQVGANRRARLANAARSFRAHHPTAAQLRGATVLVLDDVYSTGATMHACLSALAVHQPKQLLGLALLHRVA